MSKIDIKEYLGYYLGQKFRYRYVDQEPGRWMVWSELTPLRLTKLDDLSIEEIQLALRPLSSMTEGELIHCIKLMEGYPTSALKSRVRTNFQNLTFTQWFREGRDSFDKPYEQIIANLHEGENGFSLYVGNHYYRCYLRLFPYLISRGFDIFNLIPAGLAIDSTSNNTDNPPIKK